MEGIVHTISNQRAVVLVKKVKNIRKYNTKVFSFSKKRAVIPLGLQLETGQKVVIGETRPIAKKINFLIVQ